MKTIKYNFKSLFFEIESDVDLESDIISTIFPTSVNFNNPENPAQIKFKIIKPSKSEDEFLIYKDQQKVLCCKGRRFALSQLEWIITTSVLEKSSSFLQLHAGGIINDNKKAMLIVATHGTGKSSIVTGLLLKGYKCLSDDIILIDTVSDDFHSFPRAFKIGGNLYNFLPELLDLKVTNTIAENRSRRVNPERICRKPFSNTSEIGWIIFLTNNGSTECKLRPVGQIEAFSLFLQGTMNINYHGYKGIDTIANIIESAICYEMDRGNLNEAVSLLSDLMINRENNP